ncbi:MAG: response regulator [Nitrospirota bacterium]|nr:response regulator [Nitrospirota bacterium]MDE3117575.1 response regulator [Nitrospirota bacterium]MDE3241932.1 response regulator [Nitrospirota bacterium]
MPKLAPDQAANILIVEDEDATRRLLGRLLEGYGYTCTLAADAQEARRQLGKQEFALILCDVNMPGESGLDLVRQILKEYPQTAAVMVTGLDDPQLANMALESGAYGYILKPFETNEILINIANALRRRRLEIENQAHREHLEQMVRERTAELRQAITRLQGAEQSLRLSQEETVQRLAIAAEFRDNATAQHIRRMSHYSALLARRYGLAEERCELIRIASPMHDIGKIGTPDHILLKPGLFTPEEFDAITRHTEMGYRILEGSDSELLRLAATIALTHHEKFDGSGYPKGLVGEAIPLEGRIVAVADAFDALTTKRVYKPAFPPDQAMDIMRQQRGTHFDAALLDTFLASMDDVLLIKRQHNDPGDTRSPQGSPGLR